MPETTSRRIYHTPLLGPSLDISPNLSASGPRISESCCATTTFWRFEETPDADRVYPRFVRICTRGGPRSGGRFRRGRRSGAPTSPAIVPCAQRTQCLSGLQTVAWRRSVQLLG